jgi:ABC-2 type transport system permease protein
MRGLLRLIWQEFRLYLREPAAFFFTLVFPTLLIVIFGYTFGQEVVFERPDGMAFRIIDVMVAGNLSWVMASIGLLGVYPSLTAMRETRVLKFYRTHPIRAWHLMGAHYIMGVFSTALSLLIMLAVGWLLFRIRFGGNYLLTGLVLLVIYTAFFSLGFTLAAITRTARLAQALGSVIFFPMFALSGSMGPRTAFPSFLKLLSDLMPLAHAFDVLSMVWVSEFGFEVLEVTLFTFQEGTTIGGITLFQGVTVQQSLLYLLALALVTSVLAVKTFRWDTE